MAAPFADPEVGAVTGRKTVIAEDGLGYSEGLYWRYESKIRQAETRLGSTVGVNGEIFAIRRSLFAPAPQGVINDDAWMAQRVVRLGRRVVYNPAAISTERVSATAADEVLRRTRMVAGQYQTITRLHEWPWRRPVVLWELLSHKVLRPLVPFGMLGALAATVVSLFVPGQGLGQVHFITFTFPIQWLAASAQILFYGLAASGRGASGTAARITYVPRFLVDSNIAALKGLARFLTGEQPAAWEKVARRDEAPRIAA
jgi:cellulose synthase/poly-beta-1,6-N-acetylglucosamine synthase-like glycosyltransferase